MGENEIVEKKIIYRGIYTQRKVHIGKVYTERVHIEKYIRKRVYTKRAYCRSIRLLLKFIVYIYDNLSISFWSLYNYKCTPKKA